MNKIYCLRANFDLNLRFIRYLRIINQNRKWLTDHISKIERCQPLNGPIIGTFPPFVRLLKTAWRRLLWSADELKMASHLISNFSLLVCCTWGKWPNSFIKIASSIKLLNTESISKVHTDFFWHDLVSLVSLLKKRILFLLHKLCNGNKEQLGGTQIEHNNFIKWYPST